MALSRRKLNGFLVILAAVALCGLIWFSSLPHEPSRIELNQFRAAQSLRDLYAAERAYATANLRSGFTCELPRLAEAGLIDRVLAGGEKAGYRFSVTDCAPDASGVVVTYRASAIPKNAQLGTLSFCADELGSVWYAKSISTADCFERKQMLKQ